MLPYSVWCWTLITQQPFLCQHKECSGTEAGGWRDSWAGSVSQGLRLSLPWLCAGQICAAQFEACCTLCSSSAINILDFRGRGARPLKLLHQKWTFDFLGKYLAAEWDHFRAARAVLFIFSLLGTSFCKLPLKVAADNSCKRASKLTLAVAWDSLGSKSAAVVCSGSCFISFVVSLYFKSSLNWDQTVEGKVAAE